MASKQSEEYLQRICELIVLLKDENIKTNKQLKSFYFEELKVMLAPLTTDILREVCYNAPIHALDPDVQQEADFALWRSVQAYNTTSKTLFSSYYVSVLKCSMAEYLNSNNKFGLSGSIRRSFAKYNAVLNTNGDIDVHDGKIHEKMKMRKDSYFGLFSLMQPALYLDAEKPSTNTDGETSVFEIKDSAVGIYDHAIIHEQRQVIRDAIKNVLNDKERLIVDAVINKSIKIKTLAEKFGVSNTTVIKWIRKAYEKIKVYYQEHYDENYYDESDL